MKTWPAACALGLLAASASAQSPGVYERIEVPGPSLEGNLSGDAPVRGVSVYLPPGYGDSSQRYPVLYLLHGFTDSDENWFGLAGEHFVNVPDAVDAARANGAADMIVVMPNALTRFRGSMYSNSVTTGNWERYVAVDLVAHIDAHYRTRATRASRGLAGHSMGGYGALRIAMKHPDVFAAVYALSPCCMAPNMEPSADIAATAAEVRSEDDVAAASFGIQAMLASAAAWSPNPANPPHFVDLPVTDGETDPDVVARWAANAPLAMVDQYVPALESLTALHFDAGDRDVSIAATVRRLDAILDRYGVAHVAEEYAGDHVNRIHERLVTQVLPMMSETLAGR